MKNQLGYASVQLIFIVVWLAAIGGWIGNIVKIVGTLSDPITGMFIFRCVGVIVAPLGAVLGYIPV